MRGLSQRSVYDDEDDFPRSEREIVVPVSYLLTRTGRERFGVDSIPTSVSYMLQEFLVFYCFSLLFVKILSTYLVLLDQTFRKRPIEKGVTISVTEIVLVFCDGKGWEL